MAGVASKGTRGHSALQTFLFSSPFPVRKESTHWARVELFFSPSFREKKNAPVQSFLRLPARGSEDNITYVIYMHIKSLAGGCVCRKILCEEEKAAQSGRARREAPRCDSQKTRSSWWKCACTWPVRAPLSSDARGQEGRLVSRAGPTAGGLPCSHKMGFSVLCELALRWQLWELMSL